MEPISSFYYIYYKQMVNKNKNIKMKSLLLKPSLDSVENIDDNNEKRTFYKKYSRLIYGTATVQASSMQEAKEKFDSERGCDFDDNDETFEWEDGIEDSK